MKPAPPWFSWLNPVVTLLLPFSSLNVVAMALAEDRIPAPQLVPQPVSLSVSAGTFGLTDRTAIAAGPGAEAAAHHLAEALRAPTGLPLPVRSEADQPGAISIELDPGLASRLGREGYRLVVRREGVTIRAAASAGLFYGGVTLRQLLPAAIHSPKPVAPPTAWTAPCVEIEDYPRFPWRGLLIDVARHYQPVEFIERAVDLLALHKLNRLQLHLTDDQGWRIEIRKHPRLTEVGSRRRESPVKGNSRQGDGTPYGPFFYTQAQLRELVAYAQTRHVTLVPEIEMPGHFLGALAAYPQFACRGGPFQVRTRWGIEPDILCPGNDDAMAFVQDVLAEVVEVFPGPFVHIGGDEAPRDRWKECPKCQARIKAEGLRSEAELQTWLNRRVERFLASKGRRLIGWDEILEGGLTPGAAVMSWRGTAGGLAAATAGHDVVMSPTTHCYFDYSQSRAPGEPESIGGFIPLPTVYAFEPVPADLAMDQRQHILGAQGNVWTEYIRTPAELEYFAFPRAVALAEVVWSPAEARDYADFQRRLERHLQRLDQLEVNYRKLDR